MRTRVAKLAFNRGLVSRLGLARADIKRLALAAEVQTNFATRVLGSMMLRPGWGHLGSSRNDLRAYHIPFVFAIDDKAILELTSGKMRVWIDDALVTRVAVSSAVTNGNFDANVAGWTDSDEAGGVSVWVTGGYLGLTGNGTAAAIRDQTVSVAAADLGVEHALKIVIQRGPVTFRVGSTAGGDEYINEVALMTGEHSLTFTPTGDFRIRFMSTLERQVLVDSCNVEAAGAMEVSTPWGGDDFDFIRFDQSADVIFVADGSHQQRRIERRATRSWSVVTYQPEDGPFRVENVGPTTITPSGLTGNITLAASRPLFRSTHVGAIFRVTAEGQNVTKSVTAQNQFSNPIKITGVGAQRNFTFTLSNVFVATVTIQYSLIGPTGPWEDDTPTFTTTLTQTRQDLFDNIEVWRRLGVKTGDFTSGQVDIEIRYQVGSTDGVVRITAFTDSQNVSAEVFAALGATAATDNWAEGEWSDFRGWPGAVAFHEGRLCWGGLGQFDLSVSDAFDVFDANTEGDSGPISRSIGSGPVDNINWMLPLQRLLAGGDAAEFSIRSSSLDEPLTPTNFNLRAASTQGSAPVAAVKVDQTAIFVQRGGVRVYELAFGQSGIDYESSQLTALVPEIGLPGFVKLVVQRQPDTRVHGLRSDGTVAVLVFDRVEQVLCWLEVETDGEIEDIVVLPGDLGDEEDFVYYSVARTINGATKRFFEKAAFESECRGDADLCKLADSFVAYSGVATTTISAPHLAGEQVVVWADGEDVGTDADENLIYTLDGAGQATLAAAAENYVVGLPYSAQWKSAKFVELMEQPGGSLVSRQTLKSLGLILADVHAKGLKYGQSLVESEMRDLPGIEQGAPVADGAVRTDYASEPLAMPGGWTTDSRLCLLAKAPRPCTVLAAIAELEFHG